MGQRSTPCTGALLSMGWPSRLNTRPRHSSPTGTEIGAPVSVASVPRCRPSVEDIATQRTTLSPMCCATSATMVCSPLGISMALSRLGSWSSAKRMSRTGPMTWITVPLFLAIGNSTPSAEIFAEQNAGGIPTFTQNSGLNPHQIPQIRNFWGLGDQNTAPAGTQEPATISVISCVIAA